MSETVKIYRGIEVIHEFLAEDSFSRPWGLMSDNYINITLKAKENVSLLYGDYILLDGEKFTLFNTVNVTEADGIKEYPLTFYGEQYFTNRCIVEDEGATTFSYFGGVSDHMALVKLALDKYGLSRFTLGTIEENGSQLIEYDNTKGLDAINKICETFKMEWEFAGDVINIKKRVGVDTSYRFEYGKGKGAYSISLQPVQNTSIATRVIAKGGTINLPKNYPSTDNPKRLNLGSEVLDRNTNKYGIIPEVMINEDIYPRLIDKKVLDVNIPADIENAETWKIKLDIPFDLAAQYAPDQKPEVKFQTGDLAGNNFEIVENSWNNTDKTLQIIVLDQNGYKLPSANRQPRIGDEFVLLNILMPEDPYVTDAIKELKEWGQEQLNTISEPQFAPSVTVSPKYIKDNDIQLHPGDGIVIVAGGNEIHIRIQKITFPLANKRQLALELGNNVMYSYAEKLANELQDITDEIQNIRRNVQNVDRRGWRVAKETNERLGGIEESAALIGTEGGQLTFSGMFQANVNSNPNSFLTSEGRLQHFIYKDNPAGGIWNIGAFNITLQENVLYNIYAKCNKSNSNGIIYVSKEKIDTEAETGYYYFFLGTISSIFEEARSITLVTGYTFITGGYLTGQVIQDAGQRLVIDLPNAKITAKNGATIEGPLKITSGSSGLSNLEEWAAAEKDIQDAQSTANTAKGAVENIKVGGVNLLNNTYSDWIAAYNGRPSYGVDTAYFHELRNKELTYSGYIKGVNAQANLIGIEVQIHYTDGSEKYRMADTDSRGNFEVRCSNVISVDDKEIEFIHLYPLFRNGTVSGSIQIKQFQIELGNKETTWKPSLSDNEKQINTGKLFVRGTGRNNDVRAVVILNNNDQNMTIYHRGLNLITIDRIRLNVVDNLVYDTYEVLSDITALADKLNSLDSSVIAILVSYDSAANLGTDYSVLIQAIERCGGSGDSAPFAGRRIPYAFVGIPGIGKGNGIEVYTSDAANAPYAEISTQIINGIPVGMSNSASILARQTQSRLSDWASDSKISPAEKTGLKQQLAEIQATYINLHSEAERYNIVSAWTVYNNAYNLAVAALNKYTAASPEIINIESDYNNIAAYYNKEQELRANIESIATSFKIDKIIDTTGAEYDRNTYYPVVLQIKSQRRASIQIKSGLDYSKIIPSWATHERGFVCQCEWEVNANDWDESFVNRYVYSFSYRFTQNQVTPIGSIGQMGHTNNEYIYVRGGGVYKFTTTNVLGISIKTSAFTSYGETIDLLKEVAKPAVDVDVAKQQAAEADKKAAEALLKANEANFLKDAFSKSEINFGNGVVLSGAVFVENAPGSKIASAGIAGYVPSGQTQYPMIFAGANGAVNANSAKIRFYADGHGALAGGNIAWNANGDATFTGLIRSAYNGDRFEISPETKSFRMISSANKLLSNLTFWTDDFGNSVSTFQMHNHAGGIFGANCSLHLSPLGLAIYDGINEDILLGDPIVLLTRNSFMIKDFGAKIRPSSSEAQRSKLGTIIADTGNVSNGYATLRIKIE